MTDCFLIQFMKSSIKNTEGIKTKKTPVKGFCGVGRD